MQMADDDFDNLLVRLALMVTKSLLTRVERMRICGSTLLPNENDNIVKLKKMDKTQFATTEFGSNLLINLKTDSISVSNDLRKQLEEFKECAQKLAFHFIPRLPTKTNLVLQYGATEAYLVNEEYLIAIKKTEDFTTATRIPDSSKLSTLADVIIQITDCYIHFDNHLNTKELSKHYTAFLNKCNRKTNPEWDDLEEPEDITADFKEEGYFNTDADDDLDGVVEGSRRNETTADAYEKLLVRMVMFITQNLLEMMERMGLCGVGRLPSNKKIIVKMKKMGYDEFVIQESGSEIISDLIEAIDKIEETHELKKQLTEFLKLMDPLKSYLIPRKPPQAWKRKALGIGAAEGYLPSDKRLIAFKKSEDFLGSTKITEGSKLRDVMKIMAKMADCYVNFGHYLNEKEWTHHQSAFYKREWEKSFPVGNLYGFEDHLSEPESDIEDTDQLLKPYCCSTDSSDGEEISDDEYDSAEICIEEETPKGDQEIETEVNGSEDCTVV